MVSNLNIGFIRNDDAYIYIYKQTYLENKYKSSDKWKNLGIRNGES